MKIKKKYLWLLFFAFVIGLIYSIIFYLLPFFVSLNIQKIPSSCKIYAENEIKIGEKVSGKKYRHIDYDLEEYPDFLKKALVLLEDRTFYSNDGVDKSAVVRAFVNNIKAGKLVEGASTISSQLIRNSGSLNKERTYYRKFVEFMKAIKLNRKFSKKRILEKYMNSINFGYMNFGYESASQFYFGKSTRNLTRAEQIALLTIPKNPNKYNPYKNRKNFDERYKVLINYFYKNNLLDEKEYVFVKNEKIKFEKDHKQKLPYITDLIEKRAKIAKGKYNKGFMPLSDRDIKSYQKKKISTTVDYHMTQKIKEIGGKVIEKLNWKNVNDYGAIVVERKTNDIKALIGGKDYYTKEGQVNSVISTRQVGSTLKPFTYLLAFKKFGYEPSSTVLDLPVLYKTKRGYSYEPKNYNLEFKGQVTLAKALSQSLNVPAVRLANQLGVHNLLGFLRKLGISSLTKDASHYGLALTLGVGDISLFELTRAYTVFANNGKLCDFNILESESYDCQRKVKNKYIEDIVYILSNRYFKLESFPINSNLDFPERFVFKKTGTSRNFSDNFTVGFTRNYLIGVWVGNKDGEMMKGVSGASGAGEIFKKIVHYLEDKGGKNSDVSVMEGDDKKFLQITSPLDGTVLKKDSTKPLSNQKVKLDFTTNVKYDNSRWYLDGEKHEREFVSLKDDHGLHTLKIQLLRNDEVLKEEKVKYRIFEEEKK